jgi:nitrogen fixation NifU-like protein
MSYSSQVIDHCEKPRNAGSLGRSEPDVGTGLVGAPACGDVTKLQVGVNGEGDIEEARFKTFGCGPVLAEDAVKAVIADWRRKRGGEEEPCR